MVRLGISGSNLMSVYADPYMSRIGHDARPVAPISHPLVEYFTAEWEGQFCGAFMRVKFSPVEYEVHSLLHRHAVRHSRALAKEFLALCFADPISRVTAYVIEGLESAANFCRKVGFVYEGMRREACLVGGAPRGIHIFGMTRADWRAA